MPDPDTSDELHPIHCRASRLSARHVLRQRQLTFLYVLIGLTCGSLLLSSTTGPFIERASASLTHQQDLGNNLFGTTSLIAPGNFSASPQGHDVALSWSEGQSGTGYEVFGAANGTSSDCSAAIFTSLASTTATGYSDSDRFAPQGTWYCYQVQTTHDTWVSQENNPVAAGQLGFVAASLQLMNGGDTSACGEEQSGVDGDLDCGDQISVSFNQPVDATTGPGSGDIVCVDQSSGTIWLGSTGSGDCASNEEVHLGRLTGGTIENGNSRCDADYHWNAEHTALIVTIGALVSGSTYPTLSDSTWTFIPIENAGDLLSASGGYPICYSNADGGNCLPEANWTSGSSSRRERLISEPAATPTPDDRVTITETPNPIETLDLAETLSPTDPAPTGTPPTNDPFTPTPTVTPTDVPPTATAEPTVEPPAATIEPTIEPPAATAEPTIEPPTATVESTLEPISTSTP
jgi:hypothetical protein